MLYKKLDEWLNWLESLHPSTIDLGLDRVQSVASKLDLEFSNTTVYTVAGTNGKGSCVAILDTLLRKSKQTVGVYTSPHFIRYNERVKVNGSNASDEDLCRAFDKVENVRGDTSLTYFEYGTLAALVLFSEAKVNAMVLEVGLGGRLDAVNIVDPDVAVLTSIDIDHQDWLGDNREDIGREKAGIFRRGKPALCADLAPPASVLEVAATVGANILTTPENFSWDVSDSASGHWIWKGRNLDGELRIPLLSSPLPKPSISAAIQAFFVSGNRLADEQVRSAVEETQLPGRCQRLTVRDKQVVLDVAHNPAAARYLVEQLKNNSLSNDSSGKVIAVFAAMADKDIVSMLDVLKDEVQQWVFCNLANNPRAIPADELLSKGHSMGLDCIVGGDVMDGFQRAVETADNKDTVLVLGSFFTVAEVLNRIQ